MTHAAATFHSELYIATAGAIPLLWLTAGLATNAIAGLLRLFSAANALTDAVFQMFPKRLRWLSLSIRLPVSGLAILFVGAGLLGEGASIVALYSRSSAGWLPVVVLVSTLILLAYSAAVLIVATVFQEARVTEFAARLTRGGTLLRATTIALRAVRALRKLVAKSSMSKRNRTRMIAACYELRDGMDTMTQRLGHPDGVGDYVELSLGLPGRPVDGWQNLLTRTAEVLSQADQSSAADDAELKQAIRVATDSAGRLARAIGGITEQTQPASAREVVGQ